MAYPTVAPVTVAGNKNLTGTDQLLLTMFSGEVLNVFRDKNLMMSKSRVMSVGPGKDFQFPKIGQADTAYHIRGESLLDNSKSYLSDVEHTDTTTASTIRARIEAVGAPPMFSNQLRGNQVWTRAAMMQPSTSSARRSRNSRLL